MALRERAIEEVKKYAALAAYLYVCFGALLLLRTASLHDAGIPYTVWGVAIVKALVLAKFMLLGHAVHLGKRYDHAPLIWPTVYKSFLYLLLLLVLSIIEELIVGEFHHREVAESLSHVAGGTPFMIGATLIIFYLILLPYFAFQSLAEVIGNRRLIRLFFFDRYADSPRQS